MKNKHLSGHQPKVKHVGFHNNSHTKIKLGLDKAYASDTATHIEDDIMYTAGTRNLREWYDDNIKIRFGSTKYGHRYKLADEVFNEN